MQKQSDTDRKPCYKMTLEEIKEKKVGELRPATTDDLTSSIQTPRFVIHQSKPRLIDNLKASRVNETTSCQDTYIPDTVDRLLVQIRTLKSRLGDRKADIRAFAFDFKSAYKHIGIDESSQIAANLLILEPKSKKPLVTKMLCQPFGSTLSPRNWGRVVETFKFLLAKIFGINTKYFVDDGFGAEPIETVFHALDTIIEFAKNLGFTLHPDKIVRPARKITLLGAEIVIEENKIVVKNPREKARKIRTEIAKILQNKRLSPAQAASLRGRIGFSQTLMFGRLGRSRNCHLIQRQYSNVKSHLITANLKEELLWWFKNIESLPHRQIKLVHEPNNVIYSDASGEGGICLGTIVCKSDGHAPFPAYSGEAPAWLAQKNIFTLEILASVIAIAQLGA